MTSSSSPLPFLNKLTLGGVTWVAADVHLGPHGPATAACFYRFLRQAERQCDALILAGDIFHVWVGDGQLEHPEPWLHESVLALQAFARAKPLYLMRGNRDFLLGAGFARAIGATLLPDGLRLESPAGEFWLSHGDELCVDDRAYQRFRRFARARWVQGLFLACPLAWRQGIAGYLRRRSQQAGQYKSAAITDVNAQAWRALLARHGLTVLVHGHTHRPASHQEPDGPRRIVLPDWEADHTRPARGGWLSVDATGFTLHTIDP
jgi:UDP-2,3-diacylglucosamine hydrolase